jgi:hypothetical protein
MIRHEQEYVWLPKKLLLSEMHGLEQVRGNLRQGQLIPKAFLTIDRDEINFLLRIHP